MIYKKAKLFWKVTNNSKDVFCIPFNDNVEYYSFLKQYHDDGYHQIIITSEIMVTLIEHFVLEDEFSVYNIEFMEDDQDLMDEVADLLSTIADDRAYLGRLTQKLNFLSEKSSIELHRVYLKGRNSEGIAINFYLQSNGIIGISRNSYSSISNEIGNLIERCLFR